MHRAAALVCLRCRSMVGIRVKTGHSDAPPDCARTRFTICPTTEQVRDTPREPVKLHISTHAKACCRAARISALSYG